MARREEKGVRSSVGTPEVVEALDEAARLFDARRFFEAHEVLEGIWKSAATAAGDRGFWKGLTQVAVGWCHVQRGNAHGAVRLLSRAVANLEPYPSPHRGVDTTALVETARAAIRWVQERGAVPPPPAPAFPLAPRACAR
jgi:hypothetical protein